MATMHLALEDGFENDAVLIEIDGRPVLRLEGVQSSLATALAQTQSVEVPAGAKQLRVTVGTRGAMSASIELDLQRAPHVAIAIREGRLVLRSSAEPPVYL